MKLKHYSEEFKQDAVKKHLTLGLTYPELSEKLGVSHSSIYNWVRKYGNIATMTKQNKNSPLKWSPEQKLEAVIKTASMNEEELGQYLRSNGLHSTDLENFKNSFLEGFSSKGRPKLDPEVTKLRKQNNELSRNLKNKDKALAEYSARVILLKKSHEIWGTPEEDE